MLQGSLEFTAELDYYQNIRYYHKIVDDDPWLQGRAVRADGVNVIERGAEAEAFL